MRFVSYLLALLTVSAPLSAQGQLAFPGAEGFGALASGGRGGSVQIVTSLADGGPGSLQEAVNADGARIVVFAVSGVIEGDVRIPHGDLTIAGQTAPGAGITIHGHLHTPYRADTPPSNIIIRHIRVRPPPADADWPPAQHDAIQFSRSRRVIFDHISASHGIDETIDMWDAVQEFTIQWSSVTYSIPDGGHDEINHHKGIINGPGGGHFSVLHNYFAHHRNRTPAIADGPSEVINNVVYNGREGFVHHNPATGEFNIVGNMYVKGPSSIMSPLWFDPENDASTTYFVSNNFSEDPGTFEGSFGNPFTTEGYSDAYTFACCGITADQFRDSPHDFGSEAGYASATVQSPMDAQAAIVDRVGAFPRDIVDRWAIDDFTSRGGAWGERYPEDWLDGLTAVEAPVDTDRDGMADSWETTRGLDPTDGSDFNTTEPGSHYTALEDYINGLADALTGTVPPVGTDAGPRRDGGVRSDAGPADAGSSDAGIDAEFPPDDEVNGGCGVVGSGAPVWGVLLLSLVAIRQRFLSVVR